MMVTAFVFTYAILIFGHCCDLNKILYSQKKEYSTTSLNFKIFKTKLNKYSNLNSCTLMEQS